MNNKQKGFVVPIVIAVVALLVLGGGYVYYKSNDIKTTPLLPIPNVVNNLPTQTKTGNNNVSTSTVTFTSSALGIIFQYDSSKISVNEKGNIISINFAGDKSPSGDYIQVFDKKTSDSLADAVGNTILADYPSKYCQIGDITSSRRWVKDLGLTAVSISYNGPDTDYPMQKENVCNNNYLDVGSPGFFIYNPNYPSKFLFWRSGAALNTDQIFSTMKMISHAGSAYTPSSPITITKNISDIPPPLGNSTIKIFCGSEGCNTSGVNSTRSNFYITIDGTKVKVLIDGETRLRYLHGGDSDNPGTFEDIVKWIDFYPMISGPVLGMPFSATIYGDWIDATTFKANWIKWTIG